MPPEFLPMPRKQIVLLALLVEAGLGAAALLGAWIFALPIREWIVWTASGLLWGLFGGAILLLLLLLCRRFPTGPLGRLMRLVDRTVKPLFRECGVIDLLLISILAGIGEELFFRGLLQGCLAPMLGSGLSAATRTWTTAALVSVLFGVAHCISREYFVFATVLGFLLGALAIFTGDLLAPIVAHAGYDFAALLLLTRKRTRA